MFGVELDVVVFGCCNLGVGFDVDEVFCIDIVGCCVVVV